MKRRVLCLAVSAAVMLSQNTYAEEVGERHGATRLHDGQVVVEGGLTVVGQTASDGAVSDELFASLDILSTLPVGDGRLVIYVEGNTSQNDSGVSAMIGEANADAGTALDRDANGRFQVSEFHYDRSVGEGVLAAGLLDATGYLDGSDVANDETAQFLGGSFVNNPTIGFPDYALGLVYHHEQSEEPFDFTLVLTSSHGLGDNPNASYSELVDVGADGKGVFAAGEAFWTLDGVVVKAGVWVNSADHAKLDGSGNASNYGLYGVLDVPAGEAMINVRLGLANEEVSQAAHFVSVAGNYPVAWGEVGAGLAYTGLSGKDATPGFDDSIHAELYARYDVSENMHVTPSLQYIENSGFDGSEATIDARQTVAGVRLGYSF